MSNVNPIMVETLAKMTGKSEEEVIKFLEKTAKEVPPVKTHEEAKGEVVISKEVVTLEPKNQQDKNDIPPDVELELAKTLNKTAPKEVVDEVITEEVPLDSLTPEQLEEADSTNQFQSGMRVGGKVRVTWEPNA